jgi:predicted PurR-regulated permease PerM
VLWGIIIAVAIFPLHKRFSSILGNREKLSAVLIVLAGLALIIMPAVMFTNSTVYSVQSISHKLENGTISLPPLDEKVADWPVIGKTMIPGQWLLKVLKQQL